MIKSRLKLLLLVLCSTFGFAHAVVVGFDHKFVFVGDVAANSSVTKKVLLNFPASPQDFVAYCGAPFLLSTDSISFNTSVSIPSALTGQGLYLYIRLAPSVAHQVYREEVKFVYNAVDTNAEFLSLVGSSFPKDSFYNALSWNVLWFGAPGNCSCDTAIQRYEVSRVLAEIQPTVINLQEVVWHKNFKEINAAIGAKYKPNLATFASQALDSIDANWDNNQKVAYYIDTTVFVPLKSYAFAAANLGNTSTTSEYWAFASGRVPFVQPLIERGTTDTTWFFNMHAKANSDLASYNRRENGAVFLADSINAYYKKRKVALIGDFNDFLEGSITVGQPSSYQYLLDTAMIGISLPSAYPGIRSYVFGSGVIDNLCVTDSMYGRYEAGSFIVLRELYDAITDYPYSTSDHYPVMAYFKRANKAGEAPTSIVSEPMTADQRNTWIQSKSGKLYVTTDGNFFGDDYFVISNLQGSIEHTQYLHAGTTSVEISANLHPGLYLLRMRAGISGTQVHKLFVQ
jgi:hypothetical protein